MTRKFKDFMQELEAETLKEGPQAIAEAEAFKAHFRWAAHRMLEELRRKQVTL
jgi:hypothetical protein